MAKKPADRRGPGPVDLHVGVQLRVFRNTAGLTQTDVAKRLGIAAQQLQKYENGTNRMSAGRLYELSMVLSVPIGGFFEGLQQEPVVQNEELARRRTMHLMQYFYQIEDEGIRDSIYRLIQSLARNA